MRQVKIIADIGINHNGDLKIAKQLAWDAKCAGADYVKLQKRAPELCYSAEELAAPCKCPWGTTVRDKVFGRELSWDDVAKFDEYCRSIDMPWSASCFDLQSLAELHTYYPDRPWNKIAACMALDSRFVCETAMQKKLTLISLGLANEKVRRVIVGVFSEVKCPYVLNHCVPLYPTPIEESNMLHIHSIAANGGYYLGGVGYSGHETTGIPAVMAVALDAEWIEHHITFDHNAYGADHKCSFLKDEFATMVRFVRLAEKAVGDGKLHLTGKEKTPVKIHHPWPDCGLVL